MLAITLFQTAIVLVAASVPTIATLVTLGEARRIRDCNRLRFADASVRKAAPARPSAPASVFAEIRTAGESMVDQLVESVSITAELPARI